MEQMQQIPRVSKWLDSTMVVIVMIEPSPAVAFSVAVSQIYNVNGLEFTARFL